MEQFEFDELYSVKGQPGLYRIKPIGKGAVKIFRLTNEGETKIVFIKDRHDVIPLQNFVIFVTGEGRKEKPLEDVIGYILEQEQVEPADYEKMTDDQKREVMERLVPNHDPQKFMKSDMLKVLKWVKEISTALEILNKDVEDPYENNETDNLENTEAAGPEVL
jgi:hypothetical protein